MSVLTPKHNLGVAFELEYMKIKKYTWMFWFPIIFTILSFSTLLFVLFAQAHNPEEATGRIKVSDLIRPTPPLVDLCSLTEITCEGEHVGIASYYDYTLKSGWSSIGHYVAASRDYPRGSMVKVTNVETGKSVNVKITDYGPDASVHPDRIIDLSSTAFSAISSTKQGLAKVIVSSL